MNLTHQDLVSIGQIIAREMKVTLQAPPGRWLTLDEAKDYAKVTKRTLVKWINRGLIYGLKRSGKGNWIIDRESIDDWYNSKRNKI